ncbi:MAG: RNA methyltransferase [Bacteroidia bacterium]|nr:RNA methyltransferase [Bacteroidia bacterium]NNL33564.1 RNA methyltransferase [Flavobacteriaceae bacterium]
MLSKSQIQLITRLKQKKFRSQQQLFVAEGKKTINELLKSQFELHQLYTTTSAFDVVEDLKTIITPTELKKISFLKTPQRALAVFHIPKAEPIDQGNLILALDNVRDPGNLGTIIRLCDWFGIDDLICNSETVDCFNPKVVQATMGSLARVNITYTDLSRFLKSVSSKKMGAFMDGSDVYQSELPETGILVLGNEANGISANVEKEIDQRLAIPQFGKLKETESLNVANAAAVFFSEFRRRTIER